MRKFISNSPLATVIIISLITLISSILVNACRKFDHQSKPKIDKAERFLTLPPNVHPAVKRVVEKIRRVNQRTNFLNDFISRQGFARWDKAIVTGTKSVSIAGRVNAEDYCLLIPLVMEDQEQVHGAIGCKVTADSVFFTLLDGSQPESYNADSTVKGLNGRELSLTLMYLDSLVFGHNFFHIKDSAAFAGLGKNVKYARPDSISLIPSSTSRMVIYQVWICYTVWVPPHHGQVVGCDPGDPNCNDYDEEVHCDYYELGGDNGYEIDDDNPPPPSDGDSGGGGGGSDLCRFFPIDGHQCGSGNPPGWTPSYYPNNFFENYANQGYHHFETWALSSEDYEKINNWRLNNIDTSGLDSCRQLILNKLLNNVSGNLLGKILTKIDRANNDPNNIEKFNVKYHIKPLGLVVAETDSFHYNSNTGVFSVSITLDSVIAHTATDIYVAGTILHETIHAYMASLLYRIKNGVTVGQLQAMTYDSLFNEYVDTLVATNEALLNSAFINSQYQHNYMANKLLSIIADAIGLFEGNTISNTRYYWFLAWKGLYQTEPWKQHWPNYPAQPISGAPYTTDDSTRGLKYALTPSRLDSILSSIYNERVANASAYGHPPAPGGCY